MMQIDTQPGVMGAIASGIDLSGPVSADDAARLKQALLDHHLLCIRGQKLEPETYVKAARLFGEPQKQLLDDYQLDESKEVSVISNYNQLGGDKPHVRATHWHTDDSYFAKPARVTMLLAKALPSTGGGTGFIDTMRVLDEMPAELRARIEGRRAVHKYLSRRNVAKVAERTAEQEAMTPDVSHPLIRTIPEDGRQALYINPNRIDHIEGMNDEDSDELLDALYAHAFQEKFQHRHDWQLGDLVMWDNACTMHRAGTDFELTELREFHRVLLQGDVPA